MTAGEKFKTEKEESKNARILRIYQAAFELFSEFGFESITMNSIAEKAEIGVASLYRYFPSKEDLAISTATYAWTNEGLFYSQIYSSSFIELEGYTQIEKILDLFCQAIETQGPFFRFVYYFDAFIKKEKIDSLHLEEYEKQISFSKEMIISILEKGLADGSINSSRLSYLGVSVDELYYTIMHSMFSLAQKLSLSGNMLNMNDEVSPKCQMELLAKMILASLR